MEWSQVLTLILSILIPIAGMFGWGYSRLDSKIDNLTDKISSLDVRVGKVETRLEIIDTKLEEKEFREWKESKKGL